VKDQSAKALASDDFNRLRVREIMLRVGSLFTGRRDDLLSFTAVKEIVRPSDETYRGVRAVPIDSIVGSEGRYHDFTRSFLPRHRHMRGRWMNVGAARYQDISLPAVRLYEIGGAYFVRDGNHRVSVAKNNGVEFIDAEVTSLNTYFTISPDMTMETLAAAVIEYERQRFNSVTNADDLLRDVEFRFTTPGRYDFLLSQIREQQRRMAESRGTEVDLSEALRDWHDQAYAPLVAIMRSEGLLREFPDRTESDLYVWILQHWELLKRRYGASYPAHDAVRDFGRRYRRPFWRWVGALLRGRRPRRPEGPDAGAA
jgi:hypothetical protein